MKYATINKKRKCNKSFQNKWANWLQLIFSLTLEGFQSSVEVSCWNNELVMDLLNSKIPNGGWSSCDQDKDMRTDWLGSPVLILSVKEEWEAVF